MSQPLVTARRRFLHGLVKQGSQTRTWTLDLQAISTTVHYEAPVRSLRMPSTVWNPVALTA